MIPCVAFYFAYVRRTPQSQEDLIEAVGRQVAIVRAMARNKGYEIKKEIAAFLTNRDRHFAETERFREAVRLARDEGGILVVHSLGELLAVTHPDKVANAAEVATQQPGFTLIDAHRGEALTPEAVAAAVSYGLIAGSARRGPIKRGLARSKLKRRIEHRNQPKAARGASQAADRRALRLKEVVDQIRSELTAGSTLVPSILARELNARSFTTARGKSFTTRAATNLLQRLERLSRPTGTVEGQ